MLVSIIIPSFRQPQFLSRAIESCLEQDHSELEVIVVEDHSLDASLAIAASFARQDPRVRVIACAENGGLGKARNIGIAHARGDYLCFLDSDDYLLAGSITARLEALPEAVATHGEGVVAVYGDWQHVAETIDHPDVRQPRAFMPVVSPSNFTGENVFICSAPLVRSDAVRAAGGFPEGLKMLEDFALWAKMIAAGGVFVPVQHVVCTYRQRPNSMLRGDGLVVMADHVGVINDFVDASGVGLADAGAMQAWLDDRDPRSFGRMAWSVPSVLGSFGGSPRAMTVHSRTSEPADHKAANLENFMANSITSGLENPPPMWSPVRHEHIDAAISVASVADALQAVAIDSVARSAGIQVFAVVENPNEWFDLWPLTLAGVESVDAGDERLLESGVPVVDLAGLEEPAGEASARIRHGAHVVCPVPAGPSMARVYVPPELIGYPAVDAWMSTALHALAERGESPVIIADPRIRPALGGFRSEFPSIQALVGSRLLVAPVCRDLDLLSALATTVVFDPSEQTGDHARTRSQLDDALERAMSIGQSLAAPVATDIESLLARIVRGA